MTNTSDTPLGADDETIAERPDTVEVQRVVTTNEPRALPDEVIPPHPGGPCDPLVPTVVTEDERVVVEPDGAVRRQAERVEYAPEHRRRSGLVPALLIVLAIALAAIAAAWYFSQSDTASVPSVIGLPLDSAVTRLEDDGLQGRHRQPAERGRAGHRLPAEPGRRDRAGRGLGRAAARLEGPGRGDRSEYRRRAARPRHATGSQRPA